MPVVTYCWRAATIALRMSSEHPSTSTGLYIQKALCLWERGTRIDEPLLISLFKFSNWIGSSTSSPSFCMTCTVFSTSPRANLKTNVWTSPSTSTRPSASIASTDTSPALIPSGIALYKNASSNLQSDKCGNTSFLIRGNRVGKPLIWSTCRWDTKAMSISFTRFPLESFREGRKPSIICWTVFGLASFVPFWVFLQRLPLPQS